ncbi:MAG: ADOP family duplicated permease, partial [Acidobacteriota bacterium]
TPTDDETVGGHSVVVLSYDYWLRNHNADPSVIDRTLRVNGEPMTIIGVAPEGFSGAILGTNPDVYAPLGMREVVLDWQGMDDRRHYWVYLFGRLAPDVSEQRATTAINGPYHALLHEVEAPLQEGMSDQTMERFKDKKITLAPGQRGQSLLHETVETPLLMLFGVTGFVLLIAAANLANLLLIRATRRAGEIAVRLSIGARRAQVIAQLLTEALVLSLIGGAFGYFVAQATMRLIGSIVPSTMLGFEIVLGPSVWLFLVVLAAVTSLAGLFPALHVTGTDLSLALKGQAGRSSASRSANRFRAVLATAQIAVSLALLVSAGLFAKSLWNVSRVELGLDVEHLSTFAVSPMRNGYTPEQSRALFERIEQEVAALPGVRSAVGSQVPLISSSNWGSNVSVDGFADGPDIDSHSNYNLVGPGYFSTLGIPLIAGRDITASDVQGAPKVAVVNRRFAEKFGLGTDVLGKRMQVGSGGENDIEIVGLIPNAKYSEVKRAAPPLFFLPYRQDEEVGALTFYVRAAGDPKTILADVRTTMRRLDSNLPIENLQTMQVQVEQNIVVDRILGVLSTSFAVVATLLAAIGLYGILAFLVALQTREIGLRMALGADAARVRTMVLRQMGRLILPGAILGLVLAVAIGRIGQSLFFELAGHDPQVLASAVGVLVLVALAAALVPATRAARVDPMVALRDD